MNRFVRSALARSRSLVPLALVVAGVVAAIYAVDYLPTNDGAQNAYAAFVRAHVHEAPFDHFYRTTWPWSAWGWGLVFAALERALGWREAYRAAVAIAALSWVLGSAAMMSVLPRARRPLLWIAGAGALQWALYMGFFNWLLGTGLGLAAFAAGVRGRYEPRARAWVLPGLLLAAASACHPFGAQLGGFALFVHLVLSTPAASWPRRLIWLSFVGLVPLLVTAGTASGLDDARLGAWLLGNKAYMPPWSERLHGFAWFYASGPWYRWAPPLLVAGGALVAASMRARRATPLDRALAVTAVLLVGLALLTPRHTELWQNFSPRFVPISVLFASMLLPLERLPARPWRQGAHAGFVAIYAVSTGWALDYNVRLRARSEPWLAGLGAGRSARGTLLSLVTQVRLDAGLAPERFEVPFARPHVNTGLVYAMDRFEAAPHTFSVVPEVHVIQNLDAFPRAAGPNSFQDRLDDVRDPARASEVVRLASYGWAYDEVLVEGSEDIIDEFLRRGYEPIHRSARLMLGRFRGCPTTLRVEGVRPNPLHMTVVLAWDPAERPVEIDEHWTPDDFPAQRTLAHASCGPIRVRVIPDDARLACEHEDATRSLHAYGGSTIHCNLAPAR